MIKALTASAGEFPGTKIAVLVSLNIKPYAEAVQGIDRVLSDAGINPDTFFLDRYEGKALESLALKLTRQDYDLFIAVGPEASGFTWSKFQDKTVYTMVLHPEKIENTPKKICGIPFNIPVDTQIKKIEQSLPGLKRIGLLHDPEYNSSFFNQAYEQGIKSGLEIIPLEASSKKEIPLVLDKNWDKIDCLWMIPDRTIISESIIKYIIKESLLKKIPLIGYNSFFYESGAAMSFIFNYESLGKQTGETVLKVLKGDLCKDNEPEFQIWLNHKVLNSLGISFKEIDKEKGGYPEQ
ncbi:ABC transporter substrate-binding protein [Desulfonema limicola]|nr:ABC transporter substrate binding protein [Desulfonema limicola]